MSGGSDGAAAATARKPPLKVMIVSSMKFAEDIVKKRDALQALGCEVSVPNDTDLMLQKPDLCDDLDADLQHCKEQDELRKGFELVAAADAILVLNHPKNGVEGYIGTSVLMELAIAHYFKKHIFVLFPIPSYKEHRWAHEVAMMTTCCLHGDVSRLPHGVSVLSNPLNFDIALSCAEPGFRELLHWAWRTVDKEPLRFPTLADVGADAAAVSTVDSPNRERDRERVLKKGFQEKGKSDGPLRSSATGLIIAKGYLRVLFGDHGPYAELLNEQIQWEHFVHHTLKGPQRHYHEHYTAGRELHMYEQFRGVGDEPNPPPGEWSCHNNRPEGYAPYVPGRFYVSADELDPC